MTTKRSLLKALAILCIGAAVSCKKSDVETPEPPPVDPPTNTNGNSKQTPTTNRVELTNDSIFLYAKEIYYWNTALPTYDEFLPRNAAGASDLAKYNGTLLRLVKSSRSADYYSENGQEGTRFSYITDKTAANPVVSVAEERMNVDLEGNGNDVGIRFGFYGTNASFLTYVSAVYQGSPAEEQGLKRGDLVTKIGGQVYNTNFAANEARISAAIAASPLTIEVQRASGEVKVLTLNKRSYRSSPIYKKAVLTAGTRKVGYLAYARFSNPSNSLTELNTAFNEFSAQGVTDLVIDLRYNGGGYVSTAEHLINLIAPAAATGVMFAEHYNQTMQEGKATILKNQPLLTADDKVQYHPNGQLITYADVNYSVASNTARFAKKGPLTNVTNVVFIVSGNSASASELVINSLRPHMTVKLVGQTTYGKPIGFFPVVLENKYEVYLSLFETKNSRGEGGYYTGMVPDQSAPEVPAGTVMYDFGDPRDNYLARAISILAPGVTATSQAKLSSVSPQTRTVSGGTELQNDLIPQEFRGMIETRHTLKNK